MREFGSGDAADMEEVLKVPEMLEGKMVTELAPYAVILFQTS